MTVPMPGILTASLLPSGLSAYPDASVSVMAGDTPLLTVKCTDSAAADETVDLTPVPSVVALLYLYQMAADGTMQHLPVTGYPRSCTIQTPPTLGIVTLAVPAGDLATPGAYRLYLQLTYTGGAVLTTATPIAINVEAFTP